MAGHSLLSEGTNSSTRVHPVSHRRVMKVKAYIKLLGTLG